MRVFSTIIIALFSISIYAQNNFRIVFYNVENLFDTYNNPKTNDDEFTEKGMRYWSNYRYWDKVKKISKTLKIIGGWEAPAIIGLAEIENDTVLKHLIYTDVLKKYKYKIIHRDSPDHRGIDVALLYRKDRFFPINFSFFPLKDNNNKIMKSREILYTKGIVKGGDTLHFIVVHFPSRYGGYKKSEPKRIIAAEKINSICDSINECFIKPKIIIMGDFNDTPSNISIQFLRDNNNLILLTSKHGTHKYHDKWSSLDHFFISKSLIYNDKTFLKTKECNVFKEDYLLLNDQKYLGKKTNRTYFGFKYNGGFSDHLPIYIDLITE